MERRLLAAPLSGIVLGLVVVGFALATSASEAAIGGAIVLAALLVAAAAVWSVLGEKPHSQH